MIKSYNNGHNTAKLLLHISFALSKLESDMCFKRNFIPDKQRTLNF